MSNNSCNHTYQIPEEILMGHGLKKKIYLDKSKFKEIL